MSTRYTANESGVYDAVSVPPGDYSVTFTKTGFQTFVRSNIVLGLQVLTIDAQLRLGAVANEVRVTAPVPLLQTESAEQRTSMTSETLLSLPNPGNSSWRFTMLLPGVNPGGVGQNASGYTVGVNGMQEWMEQWLVDGGNIQHSITPNPGVNVPMEAIAEVNFNTHLFGAEYGNGQSIFHTITKSGTNQWHGSLFEYIQNDAIGGTRNFFAKTIPPLRWNQFGGTVGGPVKHDKLFFFFSFQRTTSINYPTMFKTYPTEAMRAGDFSAPGFPTVYDPYSLAQVNGQLVRAPLPGNRMDPATMSSVSNKMMAYWPTPNVPGLYNNYYFMGRQPDSTNIYSGKGDYNLWSHNRLQGSVSFSKRFVDLTQNEPTCPILSDWSWSCQLMGDHNYVAQITDVWILSPRTVNEARVSMSYENNTSLPSTLGQGYCNKIGLKNCPYDVFPDVYIGGAVPTSSLVGGLSNKVPDLVISTSDVFTWIRGRHIIKLGGEYDRYNVNYGWDWAHSGDLYFNGLATRNPSDPRSIGLGYADFMYGLVNSWFVASQPVYYYRLPSTQLFAQDDFKIRPNLTLNIGLRWQVQPGWTEKENKIGSFDPNPINPATGKPGAIWYAPNNGRRAAEQTVWNLFAPRVGFSWAPKSSWVVRGGYGIYYTQWNASTYAKFGTGFTPFIGSKVSTDNRTPAFPMDQGLPSPIYPTAATRTPDALNGQGVSYIPYDTPMQYAAQWRLDVQHQVKGDVMLSLAYVGTSAFHLNFTRDANQVPPQYIYLSASGTNMQPYRPYPTYSSIYAAYMDGNSNYHALQFSAQKRFSQGVSFRMNYTWSKTMDTGTGSGWYTGYVGGDGYQNGWNRKSNYGISMLDMHHMLNGYLTYQLPVGAGRTFLKNGLGSTILGGWDVAAIFQLHSGVPFTPVVGTANLSGSLAGWWLPNRIANGSFANPSLTKWFDPTAFTTPAPGTFGNSARNILTGPGWEQVDLNLTKEFRIRKLGEAASFQFRADAIDALNHPNFGQPNAAIGTTGAGRISYANSRRILQLGGRLVF